MALSILHSLRSFAHGVTSLPAKAKNACNKSMPAYLVGSATVMTACLAAGHALYHSPRVAGVGLQIKNFATETVLPFLTNTAYPFLQEHGSNLYAKRKVFYTNGSPTPLGVISVTATFVVLGTCFIFHYHSMKTKLKDMQAQCKNLEAQAQAVHNTLEENKRLNAELQTAQETRITAQAATKSAQAAAKVDQETAANAQFEVGALQKERETAKKMIEALQKELSAIHQKGFCSILRCGELAMVCDKHVGLEAAEQLKQIQARKTEDEMVQQQLVKARDTLKTLQEQLEARKQALTNQTGFCTETACWSRPMTCLSHVTELTNANAKLTKERDAAQKASQQAEELAQEARAQEVQAKVEVNALQTQIATAQANVSTLDEELAGARADATRFAEERDKAQALVERTLNLVTTVLNQAAQRRADEQTITTVLDELISLNPALLSEPQDVEHDASLDELDQSVAPTKAQEADPKSPEGGKNQKARNQKAQRIKSVGET